MKPQGKWKRPAWKWKNFRCPCGLWINREKTIEHAQTLFHQRWIRETKDRHDGVKREVAYP